MAIRNYIWITIVAVAAFYSRLCYCNSQFEHRSKDADHASDSSEVQLNAVLEALSSLQEEKLKLLSELEKMVAEGVADSAEVTKGQSQGQGKGRGQGKGQGQQGSDNGVEGSQNGDSKGKDEAGTSNGNANMDDIMKELKNAADDVLEMRELINALQAKAPLESESESVSDSEGSRSFSVKRRRMNRGVNHIKAVDSKRILTKSQDPRKRSVNNLLKLLLRLEKTPSGEDKNKMQGNGHTVDLDRKQANAVQDAKAGNPLSVNARQSSSEVASFLDVLGVRNWHDTYCSGLIKNCGGWHFNCCSQDKEYGVNMCCYWGDGGQDTWRDSGICIPSTESKVMC